MERKQIATYFGFVQRTMADNFAFAMQYGLKGQNGQGYPNPEIIQGILDLLSK